MRRRRARRVAEMRCGGVAVTHLAGLTSSLSMKSRAANEMSTNSSAS